MRYLLDTNIISSAIRDPRGAVARRIKQLGQSAICTSMIVAAELRYSALQRQSARLTQQLEEQLRSLPVYGLEPPVDEYYASVRRMLEAQGKPIGNNDLWIAAHTLALGCTLVTANIKEFSRIPDLRVENWLV